MVSRRALLVSALSGCVAVTACGGGSDPAPAPAPAPVPAPPVPAPPPIALPPLITDTELLVSGDTPFAPGCSGSANGTEYRNAEVEPQVAVNPLNPGNMVVSWQQDRWSSGGASGVVSAVTFDGGVTWTRSAFAVSRCGGGNAANGGDYSRATDPWVTFSPSGTAFQMALAFNVRFAAAGLEQRDAGGALERRRPHLEHRDAAHRQRQRFLQRQERDHGRSHRCALRVCGVGSARTRRRRPVAAGAHDRRRCELGGRHGHLRPGVRSRRRSATRSSCCPTAT